ncbi:MAG: hypothetical protein AAFO01_18630 [Pseudomonadota bacterium]
MKTVMSFVIAVSLTIGFGQDAYAYIGPGAGLSMVGAVWGLLVAVLAAFGFLLFWPFRKMFKRTSANAETEPQEKPAP